MNKKLRVSYKFLFRDDNEIKLWGPLILVLPSNYMYLTHRLGDHCNNFSRRYIQYFVKINCNNNQITSIRTLSEIGKKRKF